MRFTTLVIPACCGALFLAGCGGDRQESVAEAPAPPAEELAQMATIDEPIELDVAATREEGRRASVTRATGFEGAVTSSYADGTTELEATYRNGVPDGPWKRYSGDGSVYQEGAYVGGAKHGTWVSYHPNGQKLQEGEWHHGEPVGVHRVWLEDGTLLVERDHSRGLR